MTESNSTTEELNANQSTGLWAIIQNLIRQFFTTSTDRSPAVAAVYDQPEEEGSFVITPSGYRIRIPRPDDVHRSVGEILPGVKEGLELVPPLPQAVIELLKEIQNPAASAASVAAIAASDPSMAASLIRAVNAAALGIHRKITSVSEAVSYLGFSSVKALILRLKLEQSLGGKAATDEVSDLWIHSLMVSYIAECLAHRVPGVDPGFVSTFGLLHDIGKLVLHSRFPEETKALRASIAAGGEATVLEKEMLILGADHASLGAQLAAKWQLPGDLVKAIRWHHCPSRAFEPGDPKPLHQAMYLVQIANQLAKYCYIYDDGMEFDAVGDEAFKALGFAPNLTALLDNGVCQAAGRAIFFANESSTRALTSTRRFLQLHRGEDANRFLSSLDSSPTGARQVDVDNDICQDLFNPETTGKKPLSGAATVDGAQRLLKQIQDRLDDVQSSAADRLAMSLVTRCVLASTISTGNTPLEVSASKDAQRTRLAFRSPALSFSNRFGEACDADAALLALESELANVLNLNWFESILTSSDGSILTFTTRAAA